GEGDPELRRAEGLDLRRGNRTREAGNGHVVDTERRGVDVAVERDVDVVERRVADLRRREAENPRPATRKQRPGLQMFEKGLPVSGRSLTARQTPGRPAKRRHRTSRVFQSKETHRAGA